MAVDFDDPLTSFNDIVPFNGDGPGTATGDAAFVAAAAVLAATGTVVQPANTAPEVNAGQDQVLFTPTLETDLGGTISDDGLPISPGVTTGTWSKVSGPGTVTFDDENDLETHVAFSIKGVYVLKLLADDGDLTAEDTMRVSIIDPEDAASGGSGYEPWGFGNLGFGL